MGRRVAASVRVQDKNGANITLNPGEEVPEWAMQQVSNPAVFADDGDEARAADADVSGVVTDGDGEITHVVTGDPSSDATEADASVDYASLTVLELRAEIKRRNDTRGGDDRIPEGNKAAMIDALERDDDR